MLLSNVCGIDLGTDYIKIIDKSEKKYLIEKNMLAIRNDKYLIAVGQSAYEMYEKAPMEVTVESPMNNGVIADGEKMEAMLMLMLQKISTFFVKKPEIYMAVPSDITEVERRAFYQVLDGGVGAGKILLIHKGIADAIGMGMPLDQQIGNMIVNIGAATTEISVVCDGKIILSKMLKTGGNMLDEDIVTMVRRKYNLNIGVKTATRLKKTLSGFDSDDSKKMEVYGINTLLGLPRKETILSKDVMACMKDRLHMIAEEIDTLYNRIPPQIRAHVKTNGIYLTGGVTMMRGLDRFVEDQIGLTIHQVKDPTNSTLRGLVAIMNHKEYKKYTYSLKEISSMYR